MPSAHPLISLPPENAPAFVDQMVQAAESARASDIHLQMNRGSADITFRLDGVITPWQMLALPLAECVFGRIKFLARLATYQESMPQEGRIDKSSLGANGDIRVATYPTVTGEKIVMRLFDHGEAQTLDEINLIPEVRAEVESFLRRTSGLLLLTGPAGSGKTTTIYACLKRLVQIGGRHIITIEDPAEQIIPGVMQTEVNEAQGLTFARATRHLLRQDPQVLVVGEIRDEETAGIAVRAALTGHLMISTLHAGSCRGVVERLLLLCPDSFAVLSSLELILNQRLVRRYCANCAGAGCPHCLGTGYRGRIPIIESCRLDEPLRKRLRETGPSAIQPARDLASVAGTMVAQKITSQSEIERVLGA